MKRVGLGTEQLSYEITEEMNTLRTNLQFAGVDKKVIMVTSCMSGEGKSETLFRLAGSLAELGKKVVLVDTDMRKSILIRYCETGTVDKGLSHYLSGQCPLAEALYSTNIRGFHMMFAGPVPPNPTELLSSDLFANTIKSFREIYDYILIDCPPLGMVVDAAIVAKYCDASMLLIEANRVKYRFAQQVKEQLEATGCPILGVVLNKVDRSRNSAYYAKYYGKYGKYYGEYQKYGSEFTKLEKNVPSARTKVRSAGAKDAAGDKMRGRELKSRDAKSAENRSRNSRETGNAEKKA